MEATRHRLSCGPAIAARRGVRPRHDHRQRSLMPHIISNRRKPATAHRHRAGPAARLPRAGGLRRIVESLGANAARRPRPARAPRARAPPGRARRSGRARASRRCANACRRTGSRCRNDPRPAPPAARGGFLGGAAGGPQLPKGVTRAQYEAAIKKCGGGGLCGPRRTLSTTPPSQRSWRSSPRACAKTA